MKTERMPHKPRRAGFNPRTARRLLGYVFRPYKVQMAVVLVCILVSALAEHHQHRVAGDHIHQNKGD